jgi:hypothetical protein
MVALGHHDSDDRPGLAGFDGVVQTKPTGSPGTKMDVDFVLLFKVEHGMAQLDPLV